MSEEKIGRIYIIINRYINKYLNSEIIDYYDLFKINRSCTIEEISAKLKKLKVLLHPDIKSYLPEFMQSYYLELLQEFRNCEGVFSDIIVRENYDNKLGSINKKEQSKNSNDKNAQRKETSKEKTTESKSNDDISEFDLDSAIYAVNITSKLHGLTFTMNNVNDLLNENNFYGWEVNFSGPSRKNLLKVGGKKFQRIVRKFSTETADSKEITVDFFTYLYQNDPKMSSLMTILEGACFSTLDKYDLPQLVEALNVFVNYQNANRFTRENGYRELLEKRVRPTDVLSFARIYLNSFKQENPYYSYKNLKEYTNDGLLQIFANKFYEESNKKVEENRQKYY